MTFVSLRTDYGDVGKGGLREADVGDEPMVEVARWVDEAVAAQVLEPHAMTVATVDATGAPSARIVLARRIDQTGIVFFTNYESRKGHEIAHDSRVSLLFFWPALERQLRLEGRASRLPAAESDEYFASRPLGSRLGAWASPQSQVIPSREDLSERLSAEEARLGDAPPRPPFWGGYLVSPHVVELWQGRHSRLHDRLRWRRNSGGDQVGWIRERLAP
jgi:pyridoxamine 5'-phosphate oxidase